MSEGDVVLLLLFDVRLVVEMPAAAAENVYKVRGGRGRAVVRVLRSG